MKIGLLKTDEIPETFCKTNTEILILCFKKCLQFQAITLIFAVMK